MPLKHLPKNHGTREYIYLVIVFRVSVPQFWRLPVDGANKAANHRPGRLLDFGKPEVCNLGIALRRD